MSHDYDEDDRPLRAIAWSRLKAWGRRVIDRARPRKPAPVRPSSVTLEQVNAALKKMYTDEHVAEAVNRPHPLFRNVGKFKP